MKTFVVRYNSWIQIIAFLIVAFVSAGAGSTAEPWEKTRNAVVSAFLAYVVISFIETLTLEERLDSIHSAITKNQALVEAWVSEARQLLSGGKMVEIHQSESFNETIRLIREARKSIVHFSVGKGRSGSDAFHSQYRELIVDKLNTPEFLSFRRAGFFGDVVRRRRFADLATSIDGSNLPKLRLYDLGKESKTFLAICFLVIDKQKGIVVFTTLDGNHDKAFTVHDGAAEGFHDLL